MLESFSNNSVHPISFWIVCQDLCVISLQSPKRVLHTQWPSIMHLGMRGEGVILCGWWMLADYHRVLQWDGGSKFISPCWKTKHTSIGYIFIQGEDYCSLTP